MLQPIPKTHNEHNKFADIEMSLMLQKKTAFLSFCSKNTKTSFE